MSSFASNAVFRWPKNQKEKQQQQQANKQKK